MKLPLIVLGPALLIISLPRLAHASVSYPGELKSHWDLEALPASPPYCTLCHSTDAGGTGTVTTPFGRALLKSGALGSNVPSLNDALDALEASGSDSDRDGVTDLEELRAGLSPNEGEALPGSEPDPLADVPLPQTGCSLRLPRREPGGSVAWTALALLALRRVRSTTRR